MGTLLLLASGALRGAAFPRRSSFPLASGPLLSRLLPSSLLRRSSVQSPARPFGSRGRRSSVQSAPRPLWPVVLSALTPRRPFLALAGGVQVLAHGLGHLVFGPEGMLAVRQRALLRG